MPGELWDRNLDNAYEDKDDVLVPIRMLRGHVVSHVVTRDPRHPGGMGTYAALPVGPPVLLKETPYVPTKDTPEPNAALREIAGRILKLSYRDLIALAAAVEVGLAEEAPTEEALLQAADKLTHA